MKHGPPDDPRASDAALRRYERWLAGPGIERGLIGPRERDRLWQRHIRNCAVVAEDPTLIPAAARVVDVGSGAGLPGIVWALVRPDLTVVLVESLLRRSEFLAEVVVDLGLEARVEVVRARVEDVRDAQFDVATARAVAPLSRLLPWLAPLLGRDAAIVAFKGESAAADIAEAAGTARQLGLTTGELIRVGDDDPPTTIVRYQRAAS